MLKDPRIRIAVSFLILSAALLYSFYFKKKDIDIIPSVNAVYVSPLGGEIEYQGRKFQTHSPRQAFERIEPGKTFYFFPGQYERGLNLRTQATEKRPISLLGAKGARFTGPCITLTNAAWIFVEKLIFENCETAAIQIADSENIFLSRLDFKEQKVAVLATGAKTANLVLENSKTTGTHFFFQASGTRGDFVLRKNKVTGGKHGIWVESDLLSGPRKTGINVQIYENEFDRVQTAVQATGVAVNWWVHHNLFLEGGTWLSFPDISGGQIYIYGNIGTGAATAVMTLPEAKASLLPIYIFQNTWLFRQTYISNTSEVQLIRHFNNILMTQAEAPKVLVPENWHASLKFDHDLINFPPQRVHESMWKNLVQADPQFIDPARKDFSLQKTSPAIDRGIVLKIGDWQSQYFAEAPDIGAFESRRRIDGPRFFRR